MFCLRDGVIARPGTVDLFMFLFFFPTISAGPIDRYRRFAPDWRKRRSRAEFLTDLDSAVQHFFRGLLYKFILAALIEQHWLKPSRAAAGASLRWSVTCMPTVSICSSISPDTALSPSALVICFGVHTPENFNRPFLAPKHS